MAVELFEDKVDNLFARIFDHRLSGDIADGCSGSRIEESEEVVDLGGGADGASGILVDGFLLDGYDGAETGDVVHVRTLEVAEHISGVGREGLDIATLTLGKDCVEGQRRFSLPLSPVMTVRVLWGISTSMFFRLWTLAPWTQSLLLVEGVA